MKIVIATDGSEFSKAAIETCCRILAKTDDLEFKIVAAYETPAAMAAEPFAISAEAYQQLANIAEDRAKKAAKLAAAAIREQFPKTKIDLTSEVELDRTAAAIIETAEAWKADLIVVGSHGHGFWGRAMLGSVSDSVVHHAPCSVLVVRKR